MLQHLDLLDVFGHESGLITVSDGFLSNVDILLSAVERLRSETFLPEAISRWRGQEQIPHSWGSLFRREHPRTSWRRGRFWRDEPFPGNE